ncbi:allophanate hydrolase [Tersicoccus solisilvae]|uniref:Allophanate hydrolase n=1 Tax=Tersicoccus solisilvae TaxID=1882339 RepID=A0ABQ1PAC8_9MICC|nr:5-oxoprolinase/urea amidolyase family protein [Tersicoccus solisilvae]GGC93897.1 allophanate hydrolase [Tersicoccus solisilvae]
MSDVAVPPSAPSTPRILPDGDRALLVEVEDNAAVLALRARLRADPGAVPDAVVDVVPAARTLLVVASTPSALSAVRAWLETALAAGRSGDEPVDVAPGREITIAVRYDGPDLADVAAELGIGVDEVIARHTGTVWRLGFMGFAPGFGYLVPDDSASPADGGLAVRRLPTPRTRVRPGSVGLADGFSAVYPAASPGGWRLIGSTDHAMWDPAAEPPAAVGPGDTVRFVAADDVAEPPAAGEDGPEATDRAATAPSGRHAGASPALPRSGAAVRKLTVLQSGPQTLVQDSGRPGRADLGVSPSGALDRQAAAIATALVGNDPGTPVLEVLQGGLQVRAHAELLVAVTGAVGPVRVNAQPVSQHRAVTLPAGGLLDIGPALAGMRYYVAFQGGLEAEPVLGSASADLLSGLGPRPLIAGEEVAVGRTRLTLARPRRPLKPRVPTVDDTVVRVRPGPRRDWFDATAWEALLDARWTATGDSNRVGIRLDGPDLTRVREDELPSEGMVTGSLQVPSSGLPIVFLADHPVTGGYPVIAVVVDADLDVLAQLRPGQGLRFTDGAVRVSAGLQGSVNRIERAVGSLFRR